MDNYALQHLGRVVLAVGGIALANLQSVEAFSGPVEPGHDSLEYLKSLTLEDLLQTEISSVSKKKERLADAEAAVFVITAEDLRRTGARNIPEALRMVPGLQVAQIDGSKYAISARGFADYFSNKLLVLIDGRSVYTPLFSGVFWENQDTVMEDIERIEVIRGPGATLWGANAVNGVINIITKPAGSTQGGLATIQAGTSDSFQFSGRYGGSDHRATSYRLYGKGDRYGDYLAEEGGDANDEWKKLQSGFRLDHDGGERGRLTLQGDLYKGDEDLTISFNDQGEDGYLHDTMTFFGGNFLANWNWQATDASQLSLKAYYDNTDRETMVISEVRDTFDVAVEHNWTISRVNQVIWGVGYRITSDDLEATELAYVRPRSRTDQLFSAFLQDEINLLPDRWWLTLGSKFEHNDYTGIEVQPNVRMRYRLDDSTMFWGAISRAVRTPSRVDHDLLVFAERRTDGAGTTSLLTLQGSREFDSEELIAYELGHRCSPVSDLTLDIALFYNDYDMLRSVNWSPSAVMVIDGQAVPTQPLILANDLTGYTYGGELLASYQVFKNWRLVLGYAYIKAEFDGFDELITPSQSQQFLSGDFPEHQLQFRSYLDLPYDLMFDIDAYYVDQLSSRDVDGYLRLDLRLGWQLTEALQVSLQGENLLNNAKTEFDTTNNLVASEIPRQLLAKLEWRF